MNTLDSESLSREDLLKTLKNMIIVHTGVEGNKRAKKESENRIADSQKQLKKTGRPMIVWGFINLICMIFSIYSFFVGADLGTMDWLGIGVAISIIALGWYLLSLMKSVGLQVALGFVVVIVGFMSFMKIDDLDSFDSLIYGIFIALATTIVMIVYGYIRKAKYKKGEFAKVTTEEQNLIDEYNQKIDEYNSILNDAYEAYRVRKDLRSAAALRFCYEEIYSSSKIDINEALQHYLEKKHRDRMAELREQQIEEIRRASQQAHDDAMAAQQTQSNAASKQQSAQAEANATLRRMENDQWFKR